MRLANQFSVDAPVPVVWDLLTDVPRVAPCLPGARVLEKLGEDRYRAGMTVQLGPMTLAYEGEVELLERDASARRARLAGSAREARGQGTASAQVAFSLAPQGASTRAEIELDVQLSGRAAALGQEVLQPVAEQLVTDFTANLAQLCAGPAAPRSPQRYSALAPRAHAAGAVWQARIPPAAIVSALAAALLLAWVCTR
jgi:carbon monoxide dehydrogenase subunit G